MHAAALFNRCEEKIRILLHNNREIAGFCLNSCSSTGLQEKKTESDFLAIIVTSTTNKKEK